MATYAEVFGKLLVFDRDAIALGQYWRYLTGHFVHFTTLHLLSNMIAFSIGLALLYIHKYKKLFSLLLISSFVISIYVQIWESSISIFGGFSGIAYAFIYMGALMAMQQKKTISFIPLAIIILLPVKFAIEYYRGGSIVPIFPANETIVLVGTHIAGILSALLLFSIDIIRGNVTSAVVS